MSLSKPDFSAYMKATEIGTGCWFMMHLKSFKIITQRDVENLLADIELLRLYFSCAICKEHLNQYCKENPPEEAAEKDIQDIKAKKRAENLARLIVDLHNRASEHKFHWVSERTGALLRPDDYKYEDVREFFDTLGQVPCLKDCDKSELSSKEVKSTMIKAKSPLKNPQHNWKSESAAKPVKPLRIRVVPSSLD